MKITIPDNAESWIATWAFSKALLFAAEFPDRQGKRDGVLYSRGGVVAYVWRTKTGVHVDVSVKP